MSYQISNAIAEIMQFARGERTGASHTIEVPDQHRLLEASRLLLTTQSELIAKGHQAAFSGKFGKTVQLSHKGATILVKLVKPANVTDTSRDAYHALNVGESCQKMAVHALALMKAQGYCTDRGVSIQSGGEITAAIVAARRNDILDAGGVKVDGVTYFIEISTTTVKDPVSQRSSMTWGIKTLESLPAQTQPKLF